MTERGPNGHGSTVELEHLDVWREGEANRTLAVHEVTLSVRAGERVFLLGQNGAGKTSLLLAPVGALPFEGTIRLGGTKVEPRTLESVRARTGFVFADPSDQLFLDEVSREVAFGPRERGLAGVDDRVARALSAVRLEDRVGRSPRELSLGEQRRLAIATALAVDPEVFLLDEPTAGLDPRARQRILAVLRSLTATVVCATHDLDAALELGGRAVLLDGGRVVADGPCEDVLVDEALLDTAGLALPLSVAARR